LPKIFAFNFDFSYSKMAKPKKQFLHMLFVIPTSKGSCDVESL